MAHSENILWQGKSDLKANIWGLSYEGGGISFSLLQGAGTSQGPGYLAMILWSFIAMALGGIILASCFSVYLALVYIAIHLLCLVYWTVIREIKYYQLARKTNYKITDQFLLISYRFLGLKRQNKIPLNSIQRIHLVKYQQGDTLKGSIWIYTEKAIKTYHIAKKERANIARIEMIADYKEVHRILKQHIPILSKGKHAS